MITKDVMIPKDTIFRPVFPAGFQGCFVPMLWDRRKKKIFIYYDKTELDTLKLLIKKKSKYKTKDWMKSRHSKKINKRRKWPFVLYKKYMPKETCAVTVSLVKLWNAKSIWWSVFWQFAPLRRAVISVFINTDVRMTSAGTYSRRQST